MVTRKSQPIARRAAMLSLLAALLIAGTAEAQLKPKILIVFDTSGSMLYGFTLDADPPADANTDGSPLCGGVGQGGRVYQLKEALFQALQGIGATEADFALATFPMFVDPGRTPACASTCGSGTSAGWCSGHYFVTSAQASEVNGVPGCKVSTHTPATQTTADCGTAACPWYNDYLKEVLRVPFGKTPEEILFYFDQKEDPGPVATLSNPEVRAGKVFYTPLGKSLFYAHGYFHKDVALPASDYRKKCERLAVAMFTDGAETCNSSGSSAFYPTKWAANLLGLGVRVHTVAIDINNSLISQIASSGGGSYHDVQGNANALKTAFLKIIADSAPPVETCNGEDDDCDNEVDEDFPLKGTPCGNGLIGGCFRSGTYVCSADGSGVVCDAPPATPGEEICDGIDNDCDDEIDEIPGCIPCVPQPEVCNGKDDNCNTQIDENIPEGPCGKDVGECKPGTARCVGGVMICDGGIAPGEEICDGLDNDCDGQRDGITDVCYPFDSGCDVETTTCQGICRLGWAECTAQQNAGVWSGEWGACQGAVGPEKEICDGLDNDCDGEPDNGAECPGGSQCIDGMCTSPCSGGEFVCPTGQLCADGWCVRDPCPREECEAQGHICKAGKCVNPCEGVTCGKFQKCDLGRCVDDSCYEANPCPAGERCVQGVCEADACSTVSCDPDEYCQDGKCLKLCSNAACGAGQTCKLVEEGGSMVTRCVTDPCAGKVCGSDRVCIDGNCVVDPCEAVSCEGGQVCVAGDCVADPCESIACPSTHSCENGVCVSRAKSITEVLATGAGGCACELGGTGPDGSGLLGLLGLLALALVRRRR